MGSTIAVIVPVFNEEGTVATVLEALFRVAFPTQVVVVDDGSTDGTVERVKNWIVSARKSSLREGIEPVVVEHGTKRGKGSAIRTGLRHVAAPIVIIQDGDLEYNPADIPKIIRLIEEEKADVVFGSRYLGENPQGFRQPLLCRFGVRLLNLAVRILYGANLTDEATCYKAVRTDWLRRMALECQRFDFCPEVTAKACRMGARIVEVPISYRPRSYAEGKKIRWWDGIEALWTLWRLRNWQPGTAPAVEPASSAAGATQPALRSTSHVV
jgi:glycosyltransferase involved in cell wall biosynthesis